MIRQTKHFLRLFPEFHNIFGIFFPGRLGIKQFLNGNPASYGITAKTRPLCQKQSFFPSDFSRNQKLSRFPERLIFAAADKKLLHAPQPPFGDSFKEIQK